MDRRLRQELLEFLPRLRRFARGLTGHPADVEDLVRITVEEVLQTGVPSGVGVLRWMYTVCRNAHIDQLRGRELARKAAQNPDRADACPDSGEDPVSGETPPHEVDRELAKLSEQQRAAITLIAVEGLTYEEAAKVLGVPVGTVVQRIARARATLAASLGSDAKASTAAQPGTMRDPQLASIPDEMEHE